MTAVMDSLGVLVHNLTLLSHLKNRISSFLGSGQTVALGVFLFLRFTQMVPVKLLMTPIEKIQTIGHDESIRRASQLMRDNRIGCLLVTKDGVEGIVTETDLTRKVMAEGTNPEELPIERVMTKPILKLDAEATLLDANDLMSQKGVRHLGVERDGKLVGLVSVRDLLNFLTKYPRH